MNYVPSRRYGLPRDDAQSREELDEEYDEVEYLFEHSDYEEDDYLFIDR